MNQKQYAEFLSKLKQRTEELRKQPASQFNLAQITELGWVLFTLQEVTMHDQIEEAIV